MKVLEEHRQRVRLLRDQLERLQALRSKIFDARGESWELRSHYQPEREDKLNDLHTQIDDMNNEIELIRETYFPDQPDPATNVPVPGVTVSPPQADPGSESPATVDGGPAAAESDPLPAAAGAAGTSDADADLLPAATEADGPAAADADPPGNAGVGDTEI